MSSLEGSSPRILPPTLSTSLVEIFPSCMANKDLVPVLSSLELSWEKALGQNLTHITRSPGEMWQHVWCCPSQMCWEQGLEDVLWSTPTSATHTTYSRRMPTLLGSPFSRKGTHRSILASQYIYHSCSLQYPSWDGVCSSPEKRFFIDL